MLGKKNFKYLKEFMLVKNTKLLTEARVTSTDFETNKYQGNLHVGWCSDA